jgi:hypothetical protein
MYPGRIRWAAVVEAAREVVAAYEGPWSYPAENSR